jgi:NAD(P)-dependent dehydrogenase (short-subunit alcohol dehydrogenase family)
MINGKHVVITGGARGIGLCIAKNCKENGAKVTILSRSASELNLTKQELSAFSSGDVQVMEADVSQKKSIAKAMEASVAKFGPIYGLICGAGIYGSIGPFVSGSLEEWENGLDINIKGTAYTVYYSFPHFEKTGGRMILFSGGGQGPMENFSSYVTSKGAIWRFTETLGVELAEKNIFVNAIAPGAVNTKFLDQLIQAGPEKVGKTFYEKSLAQKASGGQSPQKAADLCLYLLSEKSHGLYGKILSAVWDPYNNLENLTELSKTDLFQYRRVIDSHGNTRN